jgi:hypothetical protein
MSTKMRLLAAAVGGVVLSGASSANAQDAVQWRVEDGGNGHWYALLPNVANRVWSSAQAEAAVLNAMLASISSAEEFNWIRDGLASSPNAWNQGWGPFLGGVQAEGAADATSGWSWLDGSPWWSAWGPNNCGADDTCVDQRWLGLGRCVATQEVSYNDELLRGGVGQCGTVSPRAAIIEWSADCNSDGIVDYGQIRAGELVDTNANNIPDCCEQGFDCRFNAVQWRVEDGGNGHWYELSIRSTGISWTSARTEALERGGQLATATSIAECNFIFNIAKVDAAWTQNRYVGPWLGGKQSSTAPGFSEPAGGWAWDSGEPWDFTNWDSFNPSNGPSGPEDFLHMAGYSASWNDIRADGEGNVRSSIIEFSADCNSDGIVDYGQIRAGELVDTNANNIPDCCEQATSCVPCAADIDESGAVNSVDLAAVLSNWGTDGGKYPRADIDGDGTVTSADLAAVLSAWGPCE